MQDQSNPTSELVATATDGTLTTTSLIIAEGTQAQHKNVLELVRNNMTDFEEFGRVAFETRPFATAGGTQHRDVAILNEQQSALLMTYMRNSDIVRDFKKRLVRAFFELRDARPVAPAELSRRDILTMALEAEDRADAAEAKMRELAAPAKSWQLLADASGDFSVAEAAKILSRDPEITTGRDRLFAFMADHKWIFRARSYRGGWEAYQTAVDTGRLVERPATPFLNSRTGEYELPAPTIRVTAKGIGKLHELMGGTAPVRFVTEAVSA
ncbi:phage regulatory protein/antirepressor Ant [Gordonia sp. MMO-8]|uniref:phage regulatory protein/antirepressor Ant n=1 Tax=Gordonia sp. MMO-8 TaxID=3127886 RepID=UPI003018021B